MVAALAGLVTALPRLVTALPRLIAALTGLEAALLTGLIAAALQSGAETLRAEPTLFLSAVVAVGGIGALRVDARTQRPATVVVIISLIT